MRKRACGFTEFLSAERGIGFCLDKAQLSGRPVQIQDCPRLQEVLVGESVGFFHPPHFSLWGFQRMQCIAKGVFIVVDVGDRESFSPMIGWRQLSHLLSDINEIKISLL